MTSGITLVAHLPYYRHAAAALHDAGLLDQYVAPPMRGRPLPGAHLPVVGKGVRYFNATRVVEGIDVLPTRQLWGTQAVALAAQRAALALDRGNALPIRARVWDASVTARLGRPSVLHVVSELAGWCVSTARRRGAVTVVDVRSAHPRAQIAAVEPLLARRGITYRLPEQGLVNRLERAFAAADVLVCNSAYTRQTFLDQGLPEDRVIAVELGCDLEAFQPAVEAERPDRFTVLFVGRERHAKGVLELADAARSLSPDSRLWLSGDPDPITTQALARVRAEIRFLGPVPPNRMPGLYRETSMLVLPSYSEGYGMVVLEAMASGLPVVVSDRVGVAEVVERSGAGRVVPVGDAEALATSLRFFEADPDARRTAGVAGAQEARSHSWGSYGERLVSAYQQSILPQSP